MIGQPKWMRAWGSFSLLWLATAAGCGGPSDLGTVAGVVTLDGQPLANATVEFIPLESGDTKSSYDGTTDASGRYKLYFAAGQEGAIPGAYSVHIWPSKPNDETPPEPAPRLPPQYNARSVLSATVIAGRNAIDFPLASSNATFQR